MERIPILDQCVSNKLSNETWLVAELAKVRILGILSEFLRIRLHKD